MIFASFLQIMYTAAYVGTDTLTYKKDSVALYDAAFRIQKEDGKVVKVVDYPLYFRNVAKEKLPEELLHEPLFLKILELFGF